MPMLSASASPETLSGFGRRQRMTMTAMLEAMEQIHRSLKVGDGFPSRRELVEQFDVSERVVRDALEEFERQGKIIRRVGRGGSVVAEPLERMGQAALNGTASQTAQELAREIENHSILAIGEPDGGIFDQAMQVLMKQAKNAKMVVHCRFMQWDEAESFAIPSAAAGPRSFVVFRQHFLPLADRLHAAGHRVVFVGTPQVGTQVHLSSVAGDQEKGGYLATRYLLDLGHRRLAFYFAGDYEDVRRWIGCRRALDEARESGIAVQHEILDWNQEDEWKQNPQQIKEYFSHTNAPTGIVSWNDDKAIKLLTILLVNGIRVPEDVSLIGYDNLKRSAEVHPALTTVDSALDAQIQAALSFLSSPPTPHLHHTIVTPTLVKRESTAAPRS